MWEKHPVVHQKIVFEEDCQRRKDDSVGFRTEWQAWTSMAISL
jgi:hypothetical protein